MRASIAAYLVFCASNLFAQAAGGLAAISGVVNDPSGSVVPNEESGVRSQQTAGGQRVRRPLGFGGRSQTGADGRWLVQARLTALAWPTIAPTSVKVDLFPTQMGMYRTAALRRRAA